MLPVKVLAVDPGKSGGWVVIEGIPGTTEAKVLYMNKFVDEIQFVYDMKLLKMNCDLRSVIIEKVHSMPQQGVATTFTFGSNFGFERGVLHAIFGEPDLIPPQKWQQYLKLTKATNKTVHKNNLKAKASEFFPDKRWTHATADASLIALHGLLRL